MNCPIEKLKDVLRNASGPEPAAWEETADWHAMALAVLDIFSPKLYELEKQREELCGIILDLRGKLVEQRESGNE